MDRQDWCAPAGLEYSGINFTPLWIFHLLLAFGGVFYFDFDSWLSRGRLSLDQQRKPTIDQNAMLVPFVVFTVALWGLLNPCCTIVFEWAQINVTQFAVHDFTP